MDRAAALVPDGALVESDGAEVVKQGIDGGDTAEKVAEGEEEGEQEGGDCGREDGAEEIEQLHALTGVFPPHAILIPTHILSFIFFGSRNWAWPKKIIFDPLLRLEASISR